MYKVCIIMVVNNEARKSILAYTDIYSKEPSVVEECKKIVLS